MRLAGYDWVPETKLTRSLREVVATRQGLGAASRRLPVYFMTLAGWDRGGFGGYVQLLHI